MKVRQWMIWFVAISVASMPFMLGYLLKDVKYSENIDNPFKLSEMSCEGLQEFLNKGWIERPIGSASNENILKMMEMKSCDYS